MSCLPPIGVMGIGVSAVKVATFLMIAITMPAASTSLGDMSADVIQALREMAKHAGKKVGKPLQLH